MAYRFACLGVRQIAQKRSPLSARQQDQAMSAYATRYEQPTADYLAFIKLASLRIWLRANESAAQSDHDFIALFEHDLWANASRLSRGGSCSVTRDGAQINRN